VTISLILELAQPFPAGARAPAGPGWPRPRAATV